MDKLKYPNQTNNKNGCLIFLIIVIAMFILLVGVNLIVQKRQEIEDKQRIERANSELINRINSTFKKGDSIAKGVTFKNMELKSPNIILNYDVDINKIENKDFIYDILVNTSVTLLNTIREIDTSSSFTNYKINYSDLASINVFSYDFIENKVPLETVQTKIETKDGRYEKEIKNIIGNKLKNEISRYDAYTSKMSEFIVSIVNAGKSEDYDTFEQIFTNARNYQNTVTIGLNNARTYSNPKTINKVNAAYNVLTQYVGLLDKIEKLVNTGKEGFISLETKTELFFKTVEIYNKTK
ncbi:hypothetical protein [Peptostreptococcus stomatis]|uniref:hypothetical protein n=1 Tax=Peptostreptococcus stomatis TaxID=341694 RepID=UPI003FA00D4C